MEKIILKYIDFYKCSSSLLLIGFLWIISIVLVRAKAIPQEPFQTIILIIDLYLTLYVYLGFVKFSLIEKKDFFRIIIFAVMALAVIHSLISKISFFYKFLGVPFAIDCILLYYAFKSVENSKIIYFRKLSRLYLYLLFFYVPISVSLLFGKESLKKFIPQMLIKPFIILALFWAALIVYTWYMKIKLFKQISRQMY